MSVDNGGGGDGGGGGGGMVGNKQLQEPHQDLCREKERCFGKPVKKPHDPSTFQSLQKAQEATSSPTNRKNLENQRGNQKGISHKQARWK